MKTYLGVAHAPIGGTGAREWVVTVIDDEGSRPLELHVDQSKGHRAHSPSGHSWGYHGSGPAQLAYDLLWDVLGREPVPAQYQAYKRQMVANWPQDHDWTTTDREIRGWILRHPIEAE